MTSCGGNEPFALRVLGDSMEPEFEDGSVVIVEPTAVIEDGCYVIAVHENEFLFRQLTTERDKWYLRALNQQYPTLEISGVAAIKGRVIAKTTSRGRERKKYL